MAVGIQDNKILNMRKIILISLVFFSVFAKAQVTVNPETFPIVSPKGKYVYTNTGGEGKFLTDSIARLARNGVNGQDSSGLGGSLNQNTEILMGGYSWINFSIKPTLLGGTDTLGLATGHTINGCGKNIATANFNDFDFTDVGSYTDTCNGDLRTYLEYGNFTTGQRKQIITQYTESNGGELYFNSEDNNNSTTSPKCNLYFDDNIIGNRRAILKLTHANGYNGDYIHIFDNNTFGSLIFAIFNDERIFMFLSSYNDDAHAGANGLISGTLYQTSATNTLGLPQGVVMIKQ